jgi:hypothetical protein
VLYKTDGRRGAVVEDAMVEDTAVEDAVEDTVVAVEVAVGTRNHVCGLLST